MSGSKDHHVKHTPSLIGFATLRAWLRDAVDFILSNQFVTSKWCCQLFEMILGAGQGLIHSSDIASASFLHSQELCGPGLASQRLKDEHELVGYCPYADNLFFILRNPEREAELGAKLHNMSPYLVQEEEFNNTKVRSLK